jgi:hypothetical protein
MSRLGLSRAVIALAWRLILVAAAAYALFAVWNVPPVNLPAPRGPLAAAEAAQAAAAPATTTAAAVASYPAIAAHPLFYPSRSPWRPPPPPPPKPPAPKAPPTLTKYALVGLIVSGDTRIALIKPPGSEKTILLGVGQELNGWMLKEITRDRLRFAAGDAGYDMTLSKPSEVNR